jgi:hypothetical protein
MAPADHLPVELPFRDAVRVLAARLRVFALTVFYSSLGALFLVFTLVAYSRVRIDPATAVPLLSILAVALGALVGSYFGYRAFKRAEWHHEMSAFRMGHDLLEFNHVEMRRTADSNLASVTEILAQIQHLRRESGELPQLVSRLEHALEVTQYAEAILGKLGEQVDRFRAEVTREGELNARIADLTRTLEHYARTADKQLESTASLRIQFDSELSELRSTMESLNDSARTSYTSLPFRQTQSISDAPQPLVNLTPSSKEQLSSWSAVANPTLRAYVGTLWHHDLVLSKVRFERPSALVSQFPLVWHGLLLGWRAEMFDRLVQLLAAERGMDIERWLAEVFRNR